MQIDSPYEAPKTVTITVEAHPEWRSVADILTKSLVKELSKDGIQAKLVSRAGDVGDANLVVVAWDPGSQFLRWAVGFGEGKAEILVQVTGTVGVSGRASGWVTGGGFGGSSEDAAEEAGKLIGHTLATGKGNDPPPRQESGATERARSRR